MSRYYRTTRKNEIGTGNGTENENERENWCVSARKRETGNLRGNGTARRKKSQSAREDEREKGIDRSAMTSTVSTHLAKVNCPADIRLWDLC